MFCSLFFVVALVYFCLCCFFALILEICLVRVWNIFVERIFEKEMEEMPKNGDFCTIDYH